ncbi:MAG: cytoplasmic protein [Pseudomonadota bacterium]|nr:cytoplasmic protein [Pseudomonadota bacterium]
MEKQPEGLDAFTIDADNLYREESITDLKAATIRKMVPIKIDGSADENRSIKFIGDTTLMTQMGPIPVQFPIEADSLEAAFGLFPEGIKAAVEKLNDRAKEMAREEASRIVVPGQQTPQNMPPGPGGKFRIE